MTPNNLIRKEEVILSGVIQVPVIELYSAFVATLIQN